MEGSKIELVISQANMKLTAHGTPNSQCLMKITPTLTVNPLDPHQSDRDIGFREGGEGGLG